MNSNEIKPGDLQETDLMTELGWLGAGAVLSLTSKSFYERVVRRPPMMALIFLLAFGLAVGLLTSIRITRNLASFDDEVRQAMVESEFPTITIESGVARMDAPQPYVLYEDADSAFIIDTTGQITRLDTGQYDQGFLLTETELHVLNEDGRYQVTNLSDINLVFGRDTLVVNAETVSEFAGGFANIVSVIAFVGLLLWHVVVRLIFVSLMALLIWALAGSYWRGVRYSDIWVVGVYASIPALYLTYMLSKISVSICGAQSILLALIMFVVTYVISPKPGGPQGEPAAPLKLKYAWIGLPLLLILAYDLLFTLPVQDLILWGTLLATAATLAVLEYFLDPGSSTQTV